MKRIILPIIILAAVACTREEPEALINFKQELTIKAYAGDPETRTERSSYGAVLWSPGDEISVFYGSGTDGGSRFTAQNTETSKVVNFSGSMDVVTGGNDVSPEDTYFWAVYPYNAYASCDGSSVTTVLPSQQLATPGTFADDLFPTLGYSKGLNMPFYNICGGLKFTLSEEGIKSITLKGNNDEIIAGTMTVGLDDCRRPIVTSIADESTTIKLTTQDGGDFVTGQTYYIVMVPTVFQNGFSLMFEKDNVKAVKYRLNKTSIRRAVFGTLSTPDKDLVWGDDNLSYVSIPDDNFRAYMVQRYDTNANGVLDYDEAENVTTINVNTDNILSVAGIEYCTNLKYLYCYGSNTWSGNNCIASGQLASLDVSHNTALIRLECYSNRLSSLDLSANTALTYLDCFNNQLTSIDICNNSALKSLYCNYNQLTSLDVSGNTALQTLYCNNNQLTSLDVGNNTNLTRIDCYSNQLSSLDLSANPALTYLDCYNNNITTLDIKSNVAFQSLYCNNNQLTSLDVSNNIALQTLYCNYNQLTSLDVSSNIALQTLYCNNNQLASLDVSNNTALQTLYCSFNQLISIDVSKCDILSYFSCGHNQLSLLDLSTNIALHELFCGTNQLTSLDISKNTALTDLSCGNNMLSTLDVSKNTALTNLSCGNNKLTTLDVSKNTALTDLSCSNNLFSILDVSKLLKLRYLYCKNNPFLAEIWLKPGQSIQSLSYDDQITTIRYLEPIGLSTTPVVITTADELLAFLANPVHDVELGANIDLSGKHVVGATIFDGIFDGKGFTIRGLTTGAPLFGELNGYVKNIIIDSSCHFEPSVSVFGIIAGVNNGIINNVTNKANVVYAVSSIDGPALIAAIAGQSSGMITDCFNEGTISIGASGATTGLGVAGIVAYQSYVIKNCINRGQVSFSASYISGKTTVVDAENVLPSVGGVCAIGAPGFLMENCHNYGSVTYSLHAAETNLVASLNRTQIGGVVGSPCGNVNNCNNYGEINVSIKHSTPGTDLPYEFIACVGGIGGGDYLFTSSSGTISNTSYYNCVNEGNIIVDSDASRSNTAVGGIVGYPGQERSSSTVVSTCVNRGTLTGRGVMKCRFGGIEGGTGNMSNCINEGKVILESGAARSSIGSLCGFHSQDHYINGCTAGGEVICSASGIEIWIGGLIGNIGNVANETGSGCIVNCKISVDSYNPQCMGMVVGRYNGTSKQITLGSKTSPIRVSGSINGTQASDSNIYGTANDLNHTIYYVIN